MYEPSNELRFLERDNMRILQQKWIHKALSPADVIEIHYEWRDVPLVLSHLVEDRGVERLIITSEEIVE